MFYAPQPWLADWSALTDVIVKANEEGEDNMATGEHKRKPIYVTCSNCGEEFLAFSKKARYCPDCKKITHRQEQARYKANMRMRESDVPDVPADDYDTLAEKIRKTAPIETCLVQHKEDNMDTKREDLLKTFPSLSNMTEHPEYFTQPTATKMAPADDGTALEKPDRKRRLMDLYGTLNAYCESFGVAASDVLDRLRKIDEALS